MELRRAESTVKSKASLELELELELDGGYELELDGGYEHTVVESNSAVGETSSSFGACGGTLDVAMWRLQKSLEEKSAAQERQTAWKRRMDLTGSRSSTSNIMSSGSNGAQTDDAPTFFLLLLGNT